MTPTNGRHIPGGKASTKHSCSLLSSIQKVPFNGDGDKIRDD
jgi:hypothetical protein